MSLFKRLLGVRLPAGEPTDPDSSNVLAADASIRDGNAEEDAGRFGDAISHYERAIKLTPRYWRAHVNLGNAMRASGRMADAVRSYRHAVELDPEQPNSHYNLGNALIASSLHSEALMSYRRATELNPAWSEAWLGLGCALEPADQQAAITAYRAALDLDKSNGLAATRLSLLLDRQGLQSDARDVIAECLRHAPRDIKARITYAHQLARSGDAEAAVEVYGKLLAELPAHRELGSAYLFTLNFVFEIAVEDLLLEHRKIAQRISDSIERTEQTRKLSPAHSNRRLKIAYLSPDFEAHPVANFVVPVLRNHDRQNFEVHCFHLNPSSDAITGLIRSLCDHWHEASELDDATLTKRIADNGIDILVDLAGHTTRNRMYVLARKPSPLQYSWLGYLGTTGLATIDYRISDHYTDPPETVHLSQVESPAYLPHSQWCYEPLTTIPPVNSLPWLTRGHWTFGSFNQGRKLHARTLALWARLLSGIPGSRILFMGITDQVLADRIAAIFSSHAIAEDRVTIRGRTSVTDYLESYNDVDIALDSYPYNGATTTFDALIMGVPVATMSGNRTITRGAASILRTLKLDDWIATSEDGFIDLVQHKCRDPAALAALRAELRTSIEASPLMDAPRFTRDLERLYREGWRKLCEAE
jgi:protein O-GlcNAc transferase